MNVNMADSRRIYLDNAATTFPKPEVVYAAIDNYNRRVGAAIGRGAYRAAIEATAVAGRCRKKVAELLGAENPDRIAFTFNGTDSLNLALYGLLKAGDHVVTSAIEHNSVLRPLAALRQRLGIEVTLVGANAAGLTDPIAFKQALRPNTKLVALIHASNVTGAIQPVADVGQIARTAGAVFLVDAAQTAGHIPIDLMDSPVDLLACPDTKDCFGPLGTGILYVRPGIEPQLASVRQGAQGPEAKRTRSRNRSRTNMNRAITTLPDCGDSKRRDVAADRGGRRSTIRNRRRSASCCRTG